MFEINEFFFSLTGLLALIALFTISIKKISVDSANVEIEKKRLLPYTNSIKTIPLDDIRRVEFEEGRFDRNTVLVEVGRAINAVRTGLSFINFYFNDKPKFRFKGIGTKTELKDLVENINRIKNNCSQHAAKTNAGDVANFKILQAINYAADRQERSNESRTSLSSKRCFRKPKSSKFVSLGDMFFIFRIWFSIHLLSDF